MRENTDVLGGESPFTQAVNTRLENLAHQDYPGADLCAENELRYLSGYYDRQYNYYNELNCQEFRRTLKQLFSGSFIVGTLVAGAVIDKIPDNLAVLSVMGGLGVVAVKSASPLKTDKKDYHYSTLAARSKKFFVDKLLSLRFDTTAVLE